MKKTPHTIYIIFAILLFAASACTRDINVNVKNAIGQLVIEGNLTNIIGPQYVKLSRNVAITSTNTYPPVSGATVTISDQSGDTYPFTEGPAGTYTANNLVGVAGTTYTLTVNVGGQTYTAQSTMPSEVPLDSINAQKAAFKAGSNQENINVFFQDPPGVANQYRFVLYDNGTQIDDVFAFNDEFTDGKDVDILLQETTTAMNPGDTVSVEMQCIDPKVYQYWYTLELESGDNMGQQTAAPANPPTNITPKTLGYFSAHTTQTKSLIVP
jgi:hypothetical protein